MVNFHEFKIDLAPLKFGKKKLNNCKVYENTKKKNYYYYYSHCCSQLTLPQVLKYFVNVVNASVDGNRNGSNAIDDMLNFDTNIFFLLV